MRFTSLTGMVGLALALTGCPDPEARFAEFEARQAASSDGGGGVGGASGCSPPIESEADGSYLFALSVVLDPPKAFALDATVVSRAGDPLIVDLTLQPLSKMDQMTPVGEQLVYKDLAVNADGTFVWDLGEVSLVNAVNPISALDVRAEVALHGTLCGGDALGFVCGTVTGKVIEPDALNGFDLAKSTFTMQRYDGQKPAPVLNCKKDPAVYPAE